MSHHYSGPDFGFPHGDARLDLTDLYAFPKPGDPHKSILIMNVHPSAAVNPPGPTTAELFAPEALYEFKIDTDGDAVADIAYRVRFSSSEGGAQTATLRRAVGAQAAGMGDSGQVIIEGAPVSTGPEARVAEAGDHASLLAGAAILSSLTCRARGTVYNSPVITSWWIKTCAASCWKCPTLSLGPDGLACGPARWTVWTGSGSRRIAARCPRKLCSLSARKEMPTSRASRRMMAVSFPSSRTRWSTRVGIRRRKQSGWQGHCCRKYCPMTRPGRRAFQAMGGHSPMMPVMLFWPSSQTGR